MMEGAEQHVVGVRERALSNVFETPKQACDDVMEWWCDGLHFHSHSKHLTPGTSKRLHNIFRHIILP